MSDFRQYSSQGLTPLRENPPCLELPSRSEACGQISRLGAREGAMEAGLPSYTACRARSRGAYLRDHCPNCPIPKGSSTSADRLQSTRGRYLRQRSLPVSI